MQEAQWWVDEVVEELLMIDMVVHLQTRYQESSLTAVKPTTLQILAHSPYSKLLKQAQLTK